ncbi:MAG: c-type cytochrome [Opitutaceae bacterium]
MLSGGDKNADQKLSREEFTRLADAWFDGLDPDQAGSVRQEEFLQRFDSVTSPQSAGRRGGGGRGGAGAAGAVGFFSVSDLDRNAILTRSEFKQAFTNWFPTWDGNKDSLIDLDEITKGLNATMPRTNMSGAAGRETQDPIPGLPTPPPSPALSPAESMGTIQLAPGFKLELAASEPMIEDPIALSFDEDGRAYVLEMRSYVLDIDRTNERDPICRISRLEDTNGDGRFDKSTVFVDGLILPRAVSAIAGGVLYVSDYKLYFARDTNGDGKADVNELVDAEYGRGNVEHAPNGLFRAMDNWIYNGESPTRYRVVNGTIVKQTTEVRGQWGMTQDNYGRLLYNVNNSQLMGDYAPANYMGRNAHHPSSAGLNLFVSTDQRVFPIRMNTAVNRGYSPEVLSPEGKAYVFASSCSPMVYRGDNYPAEFVGNAFVCDPALNLLKRNLVSDQNLTLSAKFAYEDREFLASTDERFRPVNLYNGPDGTLWFIDLYRGVAQYTQFMTAYLRRDTLARGLEKGLHFGRIYRIVSTAKKPGAFPQLSRETPAALVTRLSDPNGWIRDTAQRLLVERGDRSVVPALTQLVANGKDPLGRIHALWTLEGLFAALPASAAAKETASPTALRLLTTEAGFALEAPTLSEDVLNAVLNAITDSNPKVQVAAIRVADSLSANNPANQWALLLAMNRHIGAKTAEETLFQAALTAGNLPKTAEALGLLARIATRGSEHLIIREAILSGLQAWELPLLQALLADPAWNAAQPGRPALLQALASAVIKERQPAKVDALLTLAAAQPAEQSWRRRSVLEGIAANLAIRPLRAIALNTAPSALAALAKSDDAPTRQQAERVAALFSWPGHQSEEAAKAPGARPLNAEETALLATGQTLYQQLCFACHGLTGQGTTPLGPPLVNSDWVLGNEKRLIRIILHGVTGPIEVNGTTYQPPTILPEMPALATLDDTQVAAVTSYVRRAWGHEAAPIAPAQVTAVRAETRDRKTLWTAEQLLEIK